MLELSDFFVGLSQIHIDLHNSFNKEIVFLSMYIIWIWFELTHLIILLINLIITSKYLIHI